MRRALKVFLAASALAVALAPASARAEGYINPWAGVVFGNDAAENSFRSFGVAAGATGGRFIGLEAAVGFAPNFFDESVDNHVLDLMGNITLGPQVGTYRWRPYVTGGLGLIRTSFETGPNDSNVANNDFGFNVGGGISGYFSPHVGLRGEVRYLRTINSDDFDFPDSLDLDAGNFHFWRAQIGLVIR